MPPEIENSSSNNTRDGIYPRVLLVWDMSCVLSMIEKTEQREMSSVFLEV